MSRFVPRSASDNTDDWPFWFVADNQKGSVNCTADLMRLSDPTWKGQTLLTRGEAITLANSWRN